MRPSPRRRATKAVAYEATFYKRSDNFAEGEPKGKEVRILQVGGKFVWLDQALPLGWRTQAHGRWQAASYTRE